MIHIVDGQKLFHKTWILRKLLQNITKKYFAVIELLKYLCKTVDKIFSPILFQLCEIFQITRHKTSSYHSQTTRHMSDRTAQCLRTYCKRNSENWPKILPSVLMAIRKSPCMPYTEYAPFFLMFEDTSSLIRLLYLKTNSTSNKSLKTLILVRKLHMKMISTSKTERNNDMRNIPEFQTY